MRNQDSYSQPVALAYKNGKSMTTPCGGVLSILHTFLFLAWAVVTGFNLSNPSWIVNDYTMTGLMDDGNTPSYNVSNGMVPSIKLTSHNESILP